MVSSLLTRHCAREEILTMITINLIESKTQSIIGTQYFMFPGNKKKNPTHLQISEISKWEKMHLRINKVG